MWDEWDRGPIDSYDAYAMGLRAPRCNGCKFAQLKHELGDRCLVTNERGWVTVYELDAPPAPGQGEPTEHQGRSIRFKASFMSVGHSDECYHWAPRGKPGEVYTVRGGGKIQIREGEGCLYFHILWAPRGFQPLLDSFKQVVPPAARQYDPDTREWAVDPAYTDALHEMIGVLREETRDGLLIKARRLVERIRGLWKAD